MIWKTITLILLLNKPDQSLSAEKFNALNSQETELSVIENKYEIGQIKDDVSYQLYKKDSTPPSCLLTR